ncbi:MAG: hypothetical protein ACO24H_09070 [Polynucleobacter sp.]
MAKPIPFEIYIGKKFGMLEILEFLPFVSGEHRCVLCRCDCGKIKEARWDRLKNGSVRSCGCLISKVRIGVEKPKTASNLAGRKFGSLTALKQEYMKNNAWHWSFLCDCGNVIIRRGALVKAGAVSSCGCARKNRRKLTHGMSRSPEYGTWSRMKDRCLNPNNSRYFDYGGRGIAVCNRWLNSFENFLADMGEKPEPKGDYSIDRIDNSLGYFPANCKWSTREEQMKNRRNSVHLTLPYESRLQTKTIKEWSEITGLSIEAISARRKRGWMPHEMLRP